MAKDPELIAHLEWLGYIQPVGLVVSPPALVQAQAHVNRNVIPQQQRFLACLPSDASDEPIPVIRDFPKFVREVLEWQATDLVAFEQAAEAGLDVAGLEVVLPEYHETLRPTWVVPEFVPQTAAAAGQRAAGWVLLIQQVADDQDLDAPLEESDRRWHASPHARFERLLRETQVAAGLLTNGRQLRLVYAPRGETSGYLTFDVAAMTTVAGRPIFAALHMLLCADRLFNLEKSQRLPAILVESRKYQNTVSTQLAQQVMAALYELLRGFQAADDQWNGRLLKDVLATNPQHVYHGLLTVLMRTVFVLYAEDRNLLSNHPVYTNYYSIIGLFERLRADAGQYPDTMDQRYGAWAQLLTLFRMIYEGGSHADLRIPPRKGYLFDPERYPFLEGRGKELPVASSQLPEKNGTSSSLATGNSQLATIPRVPDGVIYRVLNNLLILDGERLSYRSLDVEQIGSVYEAIMGFEVRVSTGRSIAIRPVKKHGAPATINLEELLGQKAAERAKWLKDRTDQSITGQALETLRTAMSIDDLLAALDRKIDNLVTPNVVPANSLIFQPSDERRRSGSHYTPRSFTEPVVRTTLRPILEALGPHPRPEQILGLKVCDPAMGSGAFLVEICRQLAEALVAAWYFHDCVPQLPPDEDDLLHARRLVAQRCLYGVDKNPMAVDLAKLSLWLVTLAKDHPFTFVDHSLRAGDSLVGLTREQIVAFTWQPVAAGTGLRREKKGKKKTAAVNQPSDTAKLFSDPIADRMRKVSEYRQRILAARDDRPYEQLRQELDVADEALSLARLAGDCAIAAFFSAEKDRERVANLSTLSRQLVQYLAPQSRIEDRKPLAAAVASLINGDHPLQPFHWQIEFPEVFTIDSNGQPTGGFDAIVGNPPFAGKNTLINGNRDGYLDWLKTLHEESHGNADLVAHFFRRAFNLLRPEGCFGLIATNTIGQGDTRSTGLRWICLNGGTIHHAQTRIKWPGQASVVVSEVHVCRGKILCRFLLDGRPVPIITSYLFHAGG
ncbi:MAG TPA: SAM-dependent methyltransferase, partial [Planctomycetaceae bacterium]|nr:SAM-dependent methyltransferase [Planctomycetaceae bacterium]